MICCDDDGKVTVNGAQIDELYIYDGDEPSRDTFSVTVPTGKLDDEDHPPVSKDSRYLPDLDGGMVYIADVVGRAFATVWPLDGTTPLRNPTSTFSEVPSP